MSTVPVHSYEEISSPEKILLGNNVKEGTMLEENIYIYINGFGHIQYAILSNQFITNFGLFGNR